MWDAGLLAVLETLTVGRVLEIALWVGLAGVSIALLVLLGTSWGQSKPLQKCTILSLLVHVLLAFYAMTIRFQTGGGPGADQAAVSVTIVDHSDELSDAPDPRDDSNPWDALPAEDVHVEVPQMPDVAEAVDEPITDAFDETLPPTQPVPEINVAATMPPLVLEDTPLAAEMPVTQPAERPLVDAAAAAAIDEAFPDPVKPLEDTPQPTEVAQDDDASVEEAPVEPTPSETTETDTSLADEPPDVPAPTLDEEPIANDEAEALADVDAAAQATDASAEAADSSAPADVEPPPLALDELIPADTNAPATFADQPPSQTDTSVAGGDTSGTAAAALSAVNVDQAARDVPEVYRLRVAPNRDELARARGATAQSEGAVSAALAWLAANQEASGGWDARRHAGGRERSVLGRQRLGYDGQVAGVRADSGVTGLALLAFLGSGHTHTRTGPYQQTVAKGLSYLAARQAADGNLAGGATTYAHMYCHGMAAFALSEAYAMTGDAALAESVRRAVRYSVEAQNPYSGGWRYLPWRQRPDDRGDTSQLGWQLMALKSAELAGVGVPAASQRGMVKFLDAVRQGPQGGLASYRPDEPASPAMTAEALTCRLFLGSRLSHQATVEATDLLLRNPPGSGEMNLYYWYYATLALFQTQGDAWSQWNGALQATLTRSQVASGDLAGTWPNEDVWGGYGGRVYTTAVGALCLEVYYRYLPLYVETAGLDVQRR